jgi:hypothetical protein
LNGVLKDFFNVLSPCIHAGFTQYGRRWEWQGTCKWVDRFVTKIKHGTALEALRGEGREWMLSKD